MSKLSEELEKELKGEFDTAECISKMKKLNCEFFEKAIEIMNTGKYENLGELLKEYAKLHRTIAKLEKRGNEFAYECGIFNGSLNLTEEMNVVKKRKNKFENDEDLSRCIEKMKGNDELNDRVKFKHFFKEIGISYAENGDLLEVDMLHTNGMEDFVVDFYEDGTFKAFGIYKQ